MKKVLLMIVLLASLVFSSGCVLIQTAVGVGIAYGISKATK